MEISTQAVKFKTVSDYYLYGLDFHCNNFKGTIILKDEDPLIISRMDPYFITLIIKNRRVNFLQQSHVTDWYKPQITQKQWRTASFHLARLILINYKFIKNETTL